MTESQKFHFYFPAWSRCARANGWHMVKGRLQLDAARLNEEGRKVLALATQRAANAHRGIILDDLRHGCHLLALGRDKSSEHLTNSELDRVVSLFNLLKDPMDLGARIAWDAYARGENPDELKRLDYAIRHTAPDAYARKICKDKFGTPNWENLDRKQKRDLVKTLKERNKNFPKPIYSQKQTKELVEEPF